MDFPSYLSTSIYFHLLSSTSTNSHILPVNLNLLLITSTNFHIVPSTFTYFRCTSIYFHLQPPFHMLPYTSFYFPPLPPTFIQIHLPSHTSIYFYLLPSTSACPGLLASTYMCFQSLPVTLIFLYDFHLLPFFSHQFPYTSNML